MTDLDDKRMRCPNRGCAFVAIPVKTDRETCLNCGTRLETNDPLTRLLRDLGF